MPHDADTHPANREQATPVYGESFYRTQRNGSYRSALIALGTLFEIYRPHSVVDLGCGVGTWLSAAVELGVDDVTGVDGPDARDSGLLVPGERFIAHDLREPLDLGRRFDLAISVEVAEHLPSSAAKSFVESLTAHAPVVLFSAAIPGQTGTGHINEQWPDYWAALFAQQGYDAFDCLRATLWANGQVEYWYRQNLLLYSSNPSLIPGSDPGVPLSLVHPEQFAHARTQDRSRLQSRVTWLPAPLRSPIDAGARLIRRSGAQWRKRAHG